MSHARARARVCVVMQTEKATVNGAHTTADLQRLLGVFIDKFVLCPECHLPETALAIRKGIIYHKCAACGARKAVDMSHKLCTFILKEAASAKAEAEVKAKKEEEERVKAEKAGKDKKTASRAAVATAGLSAMDLAGAKPPSALATAAASVAARAATAAVPSSSAAAGAGVATAAEESESEEEDDVFSDSTAVAIRTAANATPAPSTAELVAKVKVQASNCGISSVEAGSLYLYAIADNTLATKLKSAPVQAVFAGLQAGLDAATTVRAQAALLRALEQTILHFKDALLRFTPVILQILYEASLVDDVVFSAWFRAKGDAEVRAKAKVFVDWMEADEEDEEDEEEDEE